MNGRRKRKRIWESCILLLMAALAMGTLTLAAADGRINGSYTLVIEKLFAEGIPQEVLDKALDQEYTFKIKGTKNKKEYEQEVKLSKKNGWRYEESADGPYNVEVTELTDNIEIEVNGEYYNMSDSTSDAAISVNTRKHELELKNNSILTISRPAESDGNNSTDVLWYHITSKPEEDHSSHDFEKLDKVFSLEAGSTAEFKYLPSRSTLCAGIYTIEQIAAPDGYQLQLEKREETVAAGETGHFHINGTPGKLTLTAGGTKGDGATHYFTIDRTEKENGDESEFVQRIVDIASEESYVLDNLPKGGYTVTEYSVEGDVDTKFSVKMPQTTSKSKTAKSSAPTYTTGTGFRTFNLAEGTTYFKLNSFGPLYDKNQKKITDPNITYEFDYGFGNEKGGITYSTVTGGPFVSNKTYELNKPPKRYPKTLKIGFRTPNVTNSDAKYIGVSWIEYIEKEATNFFDEAGKQYTDGITVDDRGWMKITAPGSQADPVVYYYTIRNNSNKLITFKNATDKKGTSLKLEAGKTIELTGLSAGSYKITETVEWKHMGFTMQVEGKRFGTTENGKAMDVQVGGVRELTISKPALNEPPAESTDNREYQFTVRGNTNNFYETIFIRAGTNKTLILPEEGKYTITPQNDKLEAYELKYTDSSAIYGTVANRASTIKFINNFAPGKYGYRYIHEYYVREADGTYTYEGNSPITTRLGRGQGETYQAGDIRKVTKYQDNEYVHFDEAYGWVDGIPPKEETVADPNHTSSRTFSKTLSTASASSAQTDEEYDFERTRRKRHSIASASSAQTVLERDSDETYNKSYFVASPSIARANANNETSEVSDDEGISTGNKGIIIHGNGKDSDGKLLNYAPETEKSRIHVTTDAHEIIILRYYRDRQPEGKYNVIHVYYLRDENGDQWEGTSGILPQKGELGIKYIRTEADTIPIFQPKNAKEPYTYTWDKRPQYGTIEENSNSGNEYNPNPDPDSDDDEYAGEGWIYRPNNAWTAAEGTKEGNQIIILRYYREPSKEGCYNIVHEYYFREKSEIQNEWEGISEHGRAAQTLNGEPGADDEENDTSDTFTGTLNRNDGYVYTFEGKTEIESITALLGSDHTEKEVKRKFNYDKQDYLYIDAGYGLKSDDNSYNCNPDQQWATSTTEGKQIIILRYYRDEPDMPDPTPEVSYNYVHEYYLKHPDGSLTLEGKSDIGTVPNADADKEYTGEDVSRIPDYKGTTYTYYECGYGNVSDSSYKEDEGKKFVKATESGDQIIILRYYREESTKAPDPSPKVSYKYIHEYYFKHPDGSLTLEGKSDIGTVPDAKAGVEYNDKNVTQVPDYEGKTYTYFNCGYGAMFSDKDYSELPDKTFIYATESGEQIIILRYEREEKPDDPKPSGGGGRKHSNPDPKPTPAPTTVPESVPEVPTIPVVESVPETSPVPEPDTPILPDPNLPGSPERITIMDGGVPKTYIKVWNPTTEEYVYLEEDDVPLTGLNDPSLPRTSDNTNFFLWISLVSASLGGIIIIGYRRFRKEH